MNPTSEGNLPAWAWAAFAITVVALLAFDLISSRGKESQSRGMLVFWSIAWISAAVMFGGFVWIVFGSQSGHEYFAAWLMEKSLSLDNLFVFLLIFEGLGIDDEGDQHKVLFWGILGAVVLRGIFVFLGTEALERWEWVSYVFGAVLMYAAWQAFRKDPARREKSSIAGWLSRWLPVKEQAGGGHFIVRAGDSWAATPLLLALCAIELSDVVFAIDSVPAALSITRDRFVIYSSNIFAILGLRALFLLMANSLGHLRYLHYGLAFVLAFAAFKMTASDWIEVPPLLAVGFIVAALGVAVAASLRARHQQSR